MVHRFQPKVVREVRDCFQAVCEHRCRIYPGSKFNKIELTSEKCDLRMESYFAKIAGEAQVISAFQICHCFICGAHESTDNDLCDIWKSEIKQSISVPWRAGKLQVIRTSSVYPKHLCGQIVRELKPVCEVVRPVAVAFRILFSERAVRRSHVDSQGHTVQWQRIPVDLQSIHIPANSLALRRSISNHVDEYLRNRNR